MADACGLNFRFFVRIVCHHDSFSGAAEILRTAILHLLRFLKSGPKGPEIYAGFQGDKSPCSLQNKLSARSGTTMPAVVGACGFDLSFSATFRTTICYLQNIYLQHPEKLFAQ
jgi:hypothetical protein